MSLNLWEGEWEAFEWGGRRLGRQYTPCWMGRPRIVGDWLEAWAREPIGGQEAPVEVAAPGPKSAPAVAERSSFLLSYLGDRHRGRLSILVHRRAAARWAAAAGFGTGVVGLQAEPR